MGKTQCKSHTISAVITLLLMNRFTLPVFFEALKMARQALAAQKLRAILTGTIIAIGIMALVGMLTATSVMQSGISNQFGDMGAGSFTIQSGGMNITIGSQGMHQKPQPKIPIEIAKRFKDRMANQGVLASVSDDVSWAETITYRNRETDPNVRVMVADDKFDQVMSLDMSEGRYFSMLEQNEARSVCIIGQDVATSLFPEGQATGKSIRARGKSYKVVGVIAPKGNSNMFSNDRVIYLPLMTGHYQFGNSYSSYVISCLATPGVDMEASMEQARVTMRGLRKLRPGEEDNFNMRRSDAISDMLIESLGFVQSAAMLIGFITLLGASIALMNIMLVSVTERTKEIGTRKALGASKRIIVVQFLAEAVSVSFMGGVAGIILGIGIGNLLAYSMNVSFVLPVQWMMVGVIISFAVGVISGWFPARQAARLNPIDALRHE